MLLKLPDGITTISDARAADYTHLDVTCCEIVWVPFELLRRPADTRIDLIAAKLRCKRCWKSPKSVGVTAQHLGHGYVRYYPGREGGQEEGGEEGSRE